MRKPKPWSSAYSLLVNLDPATLKRFEDMISTFRTTEGLSCFGEPLAKTGVLNALAFDLISRRTEEIFQILKGGFPKLYQKIAEGRELKKVRTNGVEECLAGLRRVRKAVKPFVDEILADAGLDKTNFHWTSATLLAATLYDFLDYKPHMRLVKIKEMVESIEKANGYDLSIGDNPGHSGSFELAKIDDTGKQAQRRTLKMSS